MFKLIIIIILFILILNSKPFRVYWRGRNKSENQKKAIKFLIYGPKRSKISKDDYDVLSYNMYDDFKIFEMAKRKLGITDADIVTHPYEEINSQFLCERNYFKHGDKVLIQEIDINEFRSSRMDCLMVIFGKKKLYFYQLTFRTDRSHEEEQTFSYNYDHIKNMEVSVINNKGNDNIVVSIKLIQEASQGPNKLSYSNPTQEFISLTMRQRDFEKWKAVATHLDSPELKEIYRKKSQNETKIIRYFCAYFNLPLAITDNEYEELIEQRLPLEEIKNLAINDLDLMEAKINLAAPISFRSYIYDNSALEIQGRDGSWRSNKPQVTWIFFSKDRIIAYFASAQMDDESLKKSVRDEQIYYDSISSTRTEHTSREKIIDNTRHILSYYKFTLNYAGESLDLTLPILSDENDKKIKGMRHLLNEAKHNNPKLNKNREDEDLA